MPVALPISCLRIRLRVMVVSGTKMKPMAKPLTMFGITTETHADLEIDVAQHPGGDAEQGKAEGHQQAAIDVADQDARHNHGNHGAEAARTHGQPLCSAE
jgi:hypothetical protein